MVGVPCKRLVQAQAVQVPQPDGAVPAATGQAAPIRGKSQFSDPVGMAREYPYAGFRMRCMHIPKPDQCIGAPTGQQAPIRTPGQRIYRSCGTGECLQGGSLPDIP